MIRSKSWQHSVLSANDAILAPSLSTTLRFPSVCVCTDLRCRLNLRWIVHCSERNLVGNERDKDGVVSGRHACKFLYLFLHFVLLEELNKWSRQNQDRALIVPLKIALLLPRAIVITITMCNHYSENMYSKYNRNCRHAIRDRAVQEQENVDKV